MAAERDRWSTRLKALELELSVAREEARGLREPRTETVGTSDSSFDTASGGHAPKTEQDTLSLVSKDTTLLLSQCVPVLVVI